MKLLVSENGHVHVCGHRGHSLGAPENTLASFRAAKKLGATTCEIDVVLTADHDIVVIHDLSIDRTTNRTGLVRDYSSQQLTQVDAGSWFSADFQGEPIPSLRDTLLFAKNSLGLVIEIKERENVNLLIARLGELLYETDMINDVIVISFNHRLLVHVKEIHPEVRTEGITHERFVDPVAVARAANLDSVSIELAMFDPEDAIHLHDAGIAIRCHLPRPSIINHYKKLGLDLEENLDTWIASGLIDSISGDDVSYLWEVVRRSTGGVGPRI
jgi:glycerophosphoryl diester phosphodiesterase